ncbi:MAG TPA: Flp family type IVb pilin [Hyphomicrobiaceae bacterium]|nr:Flp family type IVb pilin [Hyphomicrobiaceae bacterium]
MTSAYCNSEVAAGGFRGLARRFLRDESGATAIEYGLIATLIAVACIASFTALGGSSSQGWQGVANKASTAMK